MTQSSQSQPFLRISALPNGRGRMAAFLALLLGIFAGLAHAQNGFPPNLMSYQGYLVDANGAALAPTTPVNYSVVFRIYAVSSAGTSLWTEAQTVTVDKGNFSVVLGEGGAEGSEPRPVLSTVFNSATASDLYLGITVKGLSGNNTEIAPRLRLLTSPYSFLARTANSLAGNDGVSLITSDAGRLRINQALQTTGGNARGANAVDLQTTRAGASPGQVASGANSVIVGGQNNTASGQGAVIAGGSANTASGLWSFIGSGDNNVAGGNYSAIPADKTTWRMVPIRFLRDVGPKPITQEALSSVTVRMPTWHPPRTISSWSAPAVVWPSIPHPSRVPRSLFPAGSRPTVLNLEA